MKSTKNDKRCEREMPYPKIMVCPNTTSVFIMTDERTGTCIYKGAGMNVGQVSGSINTSGNFQDYNGSICLENEEP